MEDMSISKQVKAKIGKIKNGTIFGLGDFSSIGHPQAVALELSRLSKKGLIERLTKGKYFVPNETRFGKTGPSEEQIIESIMKENGGYLAGLSALNRLGVTTQVPTQITIRGARSTRTLKIGDLEVQFHRQGNIDADYRKPEITDVLESVRLIKNTPDASLESVLAKVTSVLKKMPSRERIDLIHLLSNERPFVRAILGALLEGLGVKAAQEIKSTLNPMTEYKIGIKKMPFPKMKEWRIS